MIRLLQTRNFRMLRSNSVPLDRFHLLVGQNATGKSTFFGALRLLSDLTRLGAPEAVAATGGTYEDLCFDSSRPVALAIETRVATDAGGGVDDERTVRYEVEIGPSESDGLRVQRENLFVLPENRGVGVQQSLFGDVEPIHTEKPRGWRKIVSKNLEGNDSFNDERTTWKHVFRFGVERSALSSLPQQPMRFPRAIAVRDLLAHGIRSFAFDPEALRTPSPPREEAGLKVDGSNLPHAVAALKKDDPLLFELWVADLAIAIDGLREVSVREIPWNKHLLLEARFAGAHEEPIPSYALSDGTLRLMALTLLNYSQRPERTEVVLIEEPENGLHPQAIQTAYEVLSRPLDRKQILAASHSPIVLAQASLRDVLVFQRSDDGGAVVRHGRELPILKDWSESASVSDLFVAGVLS